MSKDVTSDRILFNNKKTLRDERFLDQTFTNSLLLRRRGRTLDLLVYYYQWAGN